MSVSIYERVVLGDMLQEHVILFGLDEESQHEKTRRARFWHINTTLVIKLIIKIICFFHPKLYT